ncbi:MAG: hypothetical protein AAFU78_22335 [Cyanobacteria bacterium J06633_2]
MTSITSAVSTCRHCRYYSLEGRRGGLCQQLGAPVQGGWKSCQLAAPAFAPSWEVGIESNLLEDNDLYCDAGIISSYTLECLENCMHSDASDADEELLLHDAVVKPVQ